MKRRKRHFGLSLTEQTIVVAIVAGLMALSMPAAKKLVHSFETYGSTKAMVQAALCSARAMALKHQRHVGLRFQHTYEKGLDGPQYMILIVYDYDKTGLAHGFRALDGAEPIKLPETMAVMDMTIHQSYSDTDPNSDNELAIDSDIKVDELQELRDTMTFSVVFSPSGKLVIRNVRVRNRDGADKNEPESQQSMDDIFNTEQRIMHLTRPMGMFLQDEDYSELEQGLGEEKSRTRFMIVEKDRLMSMDTQLRYSEYLEELQQTQTLYVSSYTGRFIQKDTIKLE